MVRTEIFLTEDEERALRSLSDQTGRTQSELIRQAIEAMLEKEQPQDRRARLMQACGMWKDRTDLPDFTALRRELDRSWGSD